MKILDELCDWGGKVVGSLKVAGFPTPGRGWEFGRRESIDGVRGACLRRPITERRGIGKTSRPDDFGRPDTNRRGFFAAGEWSRGRVSGGSVFVVPDPRITRLCWVQRFGRLFGQS
jgi:hypothetical protein